MIKTDSEGGVRSRHQQGLCVWFTGLSGAGRFTTAKILTEFLKDLGWAKWIDGVRYNDRVRKANRSAGAA